MSNYKAFDKLMEREEQRHKKEMQKKIEDSRPIQVYRSFPSEKILEEKTAVRYLEKETGLDESVIIKSINNLLKSESLVGAYDTKQRLHLRKNVYKPL